MNFFSFTPQESKAVIFIVAILLVGSGITLYKKYHPEFAPELLLSRNRLQGKEVSAPGNTFTDFEDANSIRSEKKINLNTATLDELVILPGIGRELGKRILACREERGGFSCIEEIQKVKGIGPKTFEKLKDLITIE